MMIDSITVPSKNPVANSFISNSISISISIAGCVYILFHYSTSNFIIFVGSDHSARLFSLRSELITLSTELDLTFRLKRRLDRIWIVGWFLRSSFFRSFFISFFDYYYYFYSPSNFWMLSLHHRKSDSIFRKFKFVIFLFGINFKKLKLTKKTLTHSLQANGNPLVFP